LYAIYNLIDLFFIFLYVKIYVRYYIIFSFINLIWTWTLNFISKKLYFFTSIFIHQNYEVSQKMWMFALSVSHFFLHALHSWSNYANLNAPPFLVATYDRLICLNKFLWFAAFTLLSPSLVIRIFHCPTYYNIGRHPVWHVARFVRALIIVDTLSIINR